ncbi:MAG: hypothetical protein P8H97_11980 [Pseudomonadales bacterium]|nr:hypothetical protein [Pseudomonadales bacterium]MDG2078630.1 hypothetical protein [Pseudomonadales bacterium]
MSKKAVVTSPSPATRVKNATAKKKPAAKTPLKSKSVKTKSVAVKTPIKKKSAVTKVAAKATTPKKLSEKAELSETKKSVTTAKSNRAKPSSKARTNKSKSEPVDYQKKVSVDLAFIGSKDEVAETRNVASRERVRTELETEVEKFLRMGGAIVNVKPNVMADPPRKPESNYGSRPI